VGPSPTAVGSLQPTQADAATSEPRLAGAPRIVSISPTIEGQASSGGVLAAWQIPASGSSLASLGGTTIDPGDPNLFIGFVSLLPRPKSDEILIVLATFETGAAQPVETDIAYTWNPGPRGSDAVRAPDLDDQGASTWSPDGRYLATATGDDSKPTSVEVYDAENRTRSTWVIGGNGDGVGGWIGDHGLLVAPCLPNIDGGSSCAGKPSFVIVDVSDGSVIPADSARAGLRAGVLAGEDWGWTVESADGNATLLAIHVTPAPWKTAEEAGGTSAVVVGKDLYFGFGDGVYRIADPLGRAVGKRLDTPAEKVLSGVDGGSLGRDSFATDDAGHVFVSFDDRVAQIGGRTWTGLGGDQTAWWPAP
jgi:hypothetical protein